MRAARLTAAFVEVEVGQLEYGEALRGQGTLGVQGDDVLVRRAQVADELDQAQTVLGGHSRLAAQILLDQRPQLGIVPVLLGRGGGAMPPAMSWT